MTHDTLTLTDRYIDQTLRHVPSSQRAEVERELRAALRDATDLQREQGDSLEDAEREVLTTWGDPEALAATYADRPLALIGPRYYLDYVRLLRLVIGWVAPIAAVADAVSIYASDGLSREVFTSGLWTGGAVAVHLFFWITVGYAAWERWGKPAPAEEDPWTPEDLPEAPRARISTSDTGWSLGVIVAFAAALGFQHVQSFATDDAGNSIPFLNPDLWTAWLPLYLGVLAIDAVLVIARHRRGRWTRTHAALNTAINVLNLGVLLAILAFTEPLNPDFAASMGWENVDWVAPVIAISAAVVSAIDAREGWKNATAGRAPTA